MRAKTYILMLVLAVLAANCGIKTELPAQPPYSGGISQGDYYLEYRWYADEVTDMLVGRDSGIFYVIQSEDSLGIYPAYMRKDTLRLEGRQIFQDLERPKLLAEGRDFDLRIWIYDADDGMVKGYDGNEFLNELSVVMEFGDPDWQDVVAIAASDEGRVFVADRGPNNVYRYRVTGGPGSPQVVEDGQLSWTSQGGGATVRDLAFAEGRLLLLDDVLMTLQILDEETGPLNPPQFTYLSGLIDQPGLVTADADAIFVSDRADTTFWAIDWELNLAAAVRVNSSDDKTAVLHPVAMTVNEGKLYVADPELGMILDYEKR